LVSIPREAEKEIVLILTRISVKFIVFVEYYQNLALPEAFFPKLAPPVFL
jgi:hypothetical protein